MKTYYSFIVLIFLLIFSAACDQPDAEEYDLLIKNGLIVDGTGADGYNADILIRDGIIAEIGEIDEDARNINEIIDAEGKTVTPGFIDTHSHGDALETPHFENFLSMGVTSISLGQDGRSPGGEDVESWMDEVDELGTGPNVLHFVGQNTLRQLVDAPREVGLDDSYVTSMQEIIEKSMAAGSFGMTTGLEYDHGTFADMPELIALAEPVAEAGGIVMSHMRSEDDDKIEEALEELLDQGRGSGSAVHVSHIKIVYANNPDRADDLLAIIEEAREDGVEVSVDVYPYVASFTGIAIVFPEWALPPNDFDEVVENRRGELEEFLRDRINLRNGPEATLFGTEPWAGMTLKEVAEELEKPFEDVLIDEIGPRGASAAYFVMNEEVMQRFLVDPNVMVSSDGSPTMRHPRGYGSFAKIIRKYVNEENLMPFEEAIHKMTGLPAETLDLNDENRVDVPRGEIREGFAADLLVFEPESVRDNATFETPHELAEGFSWVIVNGEEAIRNGELTGYRNGRVIRKR